jgi:hypothetical protein
VATVIQWAGDAVEQIMELARPQAKETADALAAAIPDQVPVNDGVAKASYKPQVQETDEGYAVAPGSPFWHWLEYGTAFNPAYRPIQRAAESLGLEYEAQ